MNEWEIAFWAAVVGALVGGLTGQRLSVAYQERREKRTRNLHLRALAAEIDYCGKLAATYVKEGYPAPLYRFPTTVYETVYADLVGETLGEQDVTALTKFYSQADQMNRGLEAMHRYVGHGNTVAIGEERGRLMKKAAEMSHPKESLSAPSGGYDFYSGAIAALTRHLGK